MAGDDHAFKGAFWPAIFFRLYINVRLEKVMMEGNLRSCYTYFRSGSLMVAADSGTVSSWPRNAGDGWRKMTLLLIRHMHPPEPRTPRCTAAAGSSAIGSS
jgi:hypothetical protein